MPGRRRGAEARRALWGVAGIVIVMVIAVVIAIPAALRDFPLTASYDDNKEFAKVQAAYAADPEAFAGAVVYMEGLKAENLDAERIFWGYHILCITGPGGHEACFEPSAVDQQAFDPLPNNATGLAYYAKDPHRLFLVFNAPEPPVVYAMYAPGDERPGDFAKERGFRSRRDLGDGWTLLGAIDDRDADEEQFPQAEYPDYTWPWPSRSASS